MNVKIPFSKTSYVKKQLSSVAPNALRENVEPWLFNDPKISPDRIRTIVEDFSSPDVWCHQSASLLLLDWKDFVSENPRNIYDCAGGVVNESLYAKFCADPDLASRHLRHIFTPAGKAEDLADHFHIEAITTPEENDLVVWNLIVN